MQIRIDRGGGGGGSSGPDRRESTEDSNVDRDRGSTGGGDVGTITSGGNENVDRSGPQNHRYPGDSGAGTDTDRNPVHTPGGAGSPSDTESGPSSTSDTPTRPTNTKTSSPVGPQETVSVNGETFTNATPEDPDYLTRWEDADMFPKGSDANPIDPIDNPQEFEAMNNDENRIDLGDAAGAGENYETGHHEAVAVDSDPSEPGGGTTYVTDGPDAETSNDPAQQELADTLLDLSAEADDGIPTGTVDPTDREDVRETIQGARDRLEENQSTLSALSAALTIGSVGVTAYQLLKD